MAGVSGSCTVLGSRPAVASTVDETSQESDLNRNIIDAFLDAMLKLILKLKRQRKNARNGSGAVSAADAQDMNFHLTLGSGAVVASLLTTGKAIVVWCSKDSENSAALTDLGFLLCLGALGEAAISRPVLKPLQPVIVEIAVVHLLLEILFNSVFLRKMDPKTTYTMPTTMWIHHIASVVAGAICMTTYDGRFNGLGTKLAVTECTTFLPVAFRQARKANKLKGDRSLVLGALMPIAFIWRTWWNFTVLTDFEESVRAMRTCNPVVRALGVAATSTVLGCNCWWTLRILIGAKRIISKAFARGSSSRGSRRNKDAEQTNGDQPAEAGEGSSPRKTE